jgi:hypothetical protein
MNLFKLIESCEDSETLNFFVLSEVWKGSPDIYNAILLRYEQLDPRQNFDFGTPEFWNHDPDQEEDSNDNEDPWMLEEDFTQAGGQAQVMDEEIPKFEDLYEMITHGSKVYKRYYSGRTAVAIRFKDTSKMDNFYDLAPKIWENILGRLFGSLGPSDKIGLEINHPSLDSDIEIPFGQKQFLTGDKIANQISKTRQSKKALTYGEEMKVTFKYTKLPVGSGYKRDYRGTVLEHQDTTNGHGSCFINIRNEDRS